MENQAKTNTEQKEQQLKKLSKMSLIRSLLPVVGLVVIFLLFLSLIHIFGIDLHRSVFYQCPVDIGGNQFYHGILRFMASVAPSVIIHKCIAVL